MLRRALIVGIDDYPKNPLKGCVDDANHMEEILTRNLDEDESPNFECSLLTSEDEDVTKAVLRKNITALFAQKADAALFYFAGHGMENTLGGYLMTKDTMTYDEGVPMQDILTLANKSDIDEVMIIIDCCQSGAFGKIPALPNDQVHLREGVSVLCATRSSEEALEKDGGLFTSLVCEALEGGAADLLGNITVAGVYAYADKILGAWDQRPIFMAHVASLNPLRKCKPAIERAVLKRLPQHFDIPDEELQLDPSFEPRSPSPDLQKNAIFADLQKYRAASLLVPNDRDHLYDAAMDSRRCKLTPLGKFYWNLAERGKIG